MGGTAASQTSTRLGPALAPGFGFYKFGTRGSLRSVSAANHKYLFTGK